MKDGLNTRLSQWKADYPLLKLIFPFLLEKSPSEGPYKILYTFSMTIPLLAVIAYRALGLDILFGHDAHDVLVKIYTFVIAAAFVFMRGMFELSGSVYRSDNFHIKHRHIQTAITLLAVLLLPSVKGLHYDYYNSIYAFPSFLLIELHILSILFISIFSILSEVGSFEKVPHSAVITIIIIAITYSALTK